MLIFSLKVNLISYRYRGYGYGLCKESKANLINSLKNSDVNDISNELYFGLD